MSDIRDFAALKFTDPRQAAKWLRERYQEQVVKFPRTAIVISEAVYVHRNLPAAMNLGPDERTA